MFTIPDQHTFCATITVMVPVDHGHQEQTFQATFQIVGMKGLDDDAATLEGEGEFLRMALVGFEDVFGPDGKALLFSPATRDQLIALPFVRNALLLAYYDAVTKRAAAKTRRVVNGRRAA